MNRSKSTPSVGRLHPIVADWLQQQGWNELRPIQHHAIETLLNPRYFLRDCIMSAPTAGGKTMAALLPLCSRCLAETPELAAEPGYRILFISPLKALIRQQADRSREIATLAAQVTKRGYRDFDCTPWMGDVHTDRKQSSWAKPSGILLITPESIESRLIHDPEGLRLNFARLRFIVVDELHSYFETPRGRQLVSLLARIDARIGRSVPRICLSATLGNNSSARALNRDLKRLAVFLRPSSSTKPCVVTESGEPLESGAHQARESYFDLHLHVAMEDYKRKQDAPGEPDTPYTNLTTGQRIIADGLNSLFGGFGKVMDGTVHPPTTALIFANSRHDVETFVPALNATSQRIEPSGDWLARLSAKGAAMHSSTSEPAEPEGGGSASAGTAGAFNPADQKILDFSRYWAHHASLNAAVRHHAEMRMASGEIGCVLVCTTTLDLGIDVGTIENVAQIGPGPSVSSLRQRLGRSRRLAQQGALYGDGSDKRPSLDIFIRERAGSPGELGLLARLRLQTFQALAQITLLRRRAYESPRNDFLDLSTLLQQALSTLREYRRQGITWAELRSLLTENGPFSAARQPMFQGGGQSIFDALIERLMNSAPGPGLIDADPAPGGVRDDAYLLLAKAGAREVDSRSIYTAFTTRVEYVVWAPGTKIGSIDVRSNISVGDMITLKGQGWEVTGVDAFKRQISVRPTPHGRAPRFPGDPIPVSGLVVNEIRSLYKLPSEVLMARAKAAATLNEGVEEVLKEGHAAFRSAGLDRQRVIEADGEIYILPWRGWRHVNGIVAVLRACMLPATAVGSAVVVPGTTREKLCAALKERWPRLRDLPPHELVRSYVQSPNGKFDHHLSPTFWRHDFVSDQLSLSAFHEIAGELGVS